MYVIEYVIHLMHVSATEVLFTESPCHLVLMSLEICALILLPQNRIAEGPVAPGSALRARNSASSKRSLFWCLRTS